MRPNCSMDTFKNYVHRVDIWGSPKMGTINLYLLLIQKIGAALMLAGSLEFFGCEIPIRIFLSGKELCNFC